MLFILSAKLPNANMSPPPTLLVNLHWLPLERRIEYMIATICYNMITSTAPCLSDLFELYTPSHTLLSSADTCIFHIQNRCKKFKVSAPFLSWVIPRGTISLLLCNFLTLCWPSCRSSRVDSHFLCLLLLMIEGSRCL